MSNTSNTSTSHSKKNKNRIRYVDKHITSASAPILATSTVPTSPTPTTPIAAFTDRSHESSYSAHKKTRWESWIDDNTPYQCGWWKDTVLDRHMVHAKMFSVAFIMVMIPTTLFVGIELSNDSPYLSDLLRDAQKGSGG